MAEQGIMATIGTSASEGGSDGTSSQAQGQFQPAQQGAGGQPPSTGTTATAAGEPGEQGERRYTDRDVQNIIRKRLQEEQRKFEPYRQAMDRLLRLSGVSLDQLQQILDQYEAQNSGVDPEVKKRMDALQSAALTAAQAALENRRMIEEQAIRANPLYSDWDQVRDEVRETADRLGIGLEQAYWLLHGPQKVEAIKRETEQRVLANVANKQGLRAEGASSGEPESLGLTEAEVAAARELGMDPKEYAAFKDVIDLGSYRALKEKSAKGG